MGKLGEMAFSKLLLKDGLIGTQDTENMYKVWLGKTVVDKYDFKCKYKLDVKSIFMSNHKNLIVPLDQWNNQPKDFYIGIKVDFGDSNFYKLHKTISKNSEELDFLEKEGEEISKMVEHGEEIPETNKVRLKSVISTLTENIFALYTFSDKIDSQILGYCPRASMNWITDYGSKICPEKACKRVSIFKLEKIEYLLEELKK